METKENSADSEEKEMDPRVEAEEKTALNSAKVVTFSGVINTKESRVADVDLGAYPQHTCATHERNNYVLRMRPALRNNSKKFFQNASLWSFAPSMKLE